MDGSCSFTIKFYFKPLIKNVVSAHLAQFNFCWADQITFESVFIKNLKHHGVFNELDIYFEEFVVPLRSFALIIGYLGFYLLLTSLANYVGVHLTEKFCVTFKLSFNNVYFKCSFHNKNIKILILDKLSLFLV